MNIVFIDLSASIYYRIERFIAKFFVANINTIGRSTIELKGGWTGRLEPRG